MRLHIENMTCGGCANSVATAVRSVDPKAGIKADPASHTVEITSEVPRAVFEKALEAVGYPPRAA